MTSQDALDRPRPRQKLGKRARGRDIDLAEKLGLAKPTKKLRR